MRLTCQTRAARRGEPRTSQIISEIAPASYALVSGGSRSAWPGFAPFAGPWRCRSHARDFSRRAASARRAAARASRRCQINKYSSDDAVSLSASDSDRIILSRMLAESRPCSWSDLLLLTVTPKRLRSSSCCHNNMQLAGLHRLQTASSCFWRSAMGSMLCAAIKPAVTNGQCRRGLSWDRALRIEARVESLSTGAGAWKSFSDSPGLGHGLTTATQQLI